MQHFLASQRAASSHLPATRARVKNEMIHPFFCYVGIAMSFGLSFALFIPGIVDARRFFYLPIVLLIAFYTAHAMATDKETYRKRNFRQSAWTATGKYFFWGVILLAVIALYRYHPGYQSLTPNTRFFVQHFFVAFLVLGWPYLFLAEKYRHSASNVLLDPYRTTMLLLRCLKRRRTDLFKRRLATRQTKRMLISGALRVHFVPVMVEQVYLGVTALTLQAQAQTDQIHFSTAGFGLEAHTVALPVVAVLTSLAWLIDSNNASVGYFWESRFTKTSFREMDPHPSHWVVTLACYAPFIFFVNAYVAEFPALAEDSPRIFSQSAVNTAIDITMITVLLLYMLSGSALAFSFSNLSYKKIQTRGPYRYMRHPSITFKVIWFTLAFYRFAPAYSIGWLLCYIAWMAIYITRAFVEERFLRRFPEYREYMRQTPYRFIPGVI